MYDFVVATQLRILTTNRIHAMRAGGNDLLGANFIQDFDIGLRLHLVEEFVAGAAGRVAGAGFVLAQHGVVDPGGVEDPGEGLGGLRLVSVHEIEAEIAGNVRVQLRRARLKGRLLVHHAPSWALPYAPAAQNAVAQARVFAASVPVTGLVLTKLDGTAKGGVLAAIALWSRERALTHGRGISVYFIGVGEQLQDLERFDAQEFALALLG